MNLKQIVLDKDALLGIGFNSLHDFAGNHVLLVCDRLLYECLTAAGRRDRRLLDGWRNLIEAGAYYCSCKRILLPSPNGRNSGDKRAEHDYQDMEYVLLLSRADAILTRDKKLVKPLAEAAFPDRDVFFDLDEVPDEYVCHWN